MEKVQKNKAMRLAYFLLIAVLITMCAVGGTFAKYTTTASATDSARVAKFGVSVEATGSLFATTYKAADKNTPGTGDEGETLTVSSTDKVVAPGTQSTATGLQFAFTGTTETAVKVDVTVNATDVFLKGDNATYTDYTTNPTGTFTNTTDYYPVKYTLTQKLGSEDANTLVDGKTMADVEEALEGLTTKAVDGVTQINANTDLAKTIGTLTLTWAWDFDDSTKGTYDKQDTLLGKLAAGTATLDSGAYNLSPSIAIKVTITQVD